VPEYVPQNDDISTPSAGDIFKRCRQFQEMTLEDAATATKIGVEYLQALEDNNLAQFTSLAYLKGFVRIYATSLGLNPDDMIRMYAKAYSQDEASVPASTAGTARKRRLAIPLQRLILPLVLLSLVLITSAIMNRPASTPQRPTLPLPAPALTLPAPQAIISSSRANPTPVTQHETSSEEKTVTASDTAAKETAPPAEESVKGFILALKAVRNSTLTVTVDASEPEQHELTAGDRIEWRALQTITLDLSDIGAVEAFQNGKLLPPFGSKSVTLRAEKTP